MAPKAATTSGGAAASSSRSSQSGAGIASASRKARRSPRASAAPRLRATPCGVRCGRATTLSHGNAPAIRSALPSPLLSTAIASRPARICGASAVSTAPSTGPGRYTGITTVVLMVRSSMVGQPRRRRSSCHAGQASRAPIPDQKEAGQDARHWRRTLPGERSVLADGRDVRCLRALLALGLLELHLRAFLERLVATRLNRAEVDEQVGAATIGGDEAVALVSVEPLDGSGCHADSFLLFWYAERGGKCDDNPVLVLLCRGPS